MLLNFSDRTRTGVFNMVWPLPREGVKSARLKMQSWQCWVRLGFLNQGFSACGIQTRSLAACWANFVQKFFKLFDVYTGEPNFYYPREGGRLKRRKGNRLEMDEMQESPLPTTWEDVAPMPPFLPCGNGKFSHFPREIMVICFVVNKGESRNFPVSILIPVHFF